jgi:hypothetical protein
LAANAICLIVAGVVRASLPSSEFTLAWEHSVEKTLWEERYRVDAGKLVLVEARVRGTGAGMEPGPDAHFVDGWWKWRPPLAPLTGLHLAASRYTSDYELCWNDRCSALRQLTGTASPDQVVTIAPCPATDVR